MNKKNLSVVMAGAMLATSVAPVLADSTTDSTVYEVTKGNVGLLIDKLDTLFKTCPKFDESVTLNKTLAGKPVYNYQYRKVGDKVWTAAGTDTSKLKTVIAADSSNEYEVQVIDLGHKEVDGKVVAYEVSTINWNGYVYTATELEAYETALPTGNHLTDLAFNEMAKSKVITKFDANATSGSSTKADVTLASGVSFELNLTDKKYELDFSAPIDSTGKVMSLSEAKEYPNKVYGFEYKAVTAASTGADIPTSVLYDVKVINGDTVENYNVNDLYDGLMLTTKGHELLREMKTVTADGGSVNVNSVVTAPDKDGNVYSMSVEINDGVNKKVVSIKGDNKGRIDTLYKWLNQKRADVDILAGENRYATAVEIAKDFIVGTVYNNKTTVNNIVLVNGEALVDGLAAAPYAKTVNAPILLTAEDKLPTETKEYLKEFRENKTIGTTVPTVTIVGGTSVVSSNIVEELKDLGFKVKRIAGDNREQTSLEVADEIAKVNGSKTNAFVVGAEGEADAMSIASYAASTKTPIIVSKSSKGLSTMALNELDDYTGKTVIIGGDKAVTSKDEETLKELNDKSNVERIAGANRFETNAMVIKKYHKNFTSVLVSKDGQRKESELVDALPVSMFASVNTNQTTFGDPTTASPIVLATDKLSDAQLNQVVLNSAGNTTSTLYQVGYGVNRSVIEKVADRLGLLK